MKSEIIIGVIINLKELIDNRCNISQRESIDLALFKTRIIAFQPVAILRTTLVTTALLICVATVFSPQAGAQDYLRSELLGETNTAVYVYAGPGDATVQVSLWGTIGATGIYEVREGTRLDKLLTLAGGLPIQARERRQSADITVRLFRLTGGEREAIYEAPLEDLVRNPSRYPTLQDDDVIIVDTETHRSIGWRDVLSVVSSIGSLILVFDRLFFRGR